MRLSDFEKDVVVSAVETIDPKAEVYLFGSRTDNYAKGGDIDLLVISQTIDLLKKIKILNMIFEKIEERKLDLVVKKDRTSAFVQLIEQQLLCLNGK